MKPTILAPILAVALLTVLAVPARLAGQVGGTGATNRIPIWTNSTTLGNSILFQTGGKVGIGNTSPAARLDVTGQSGTNGIAGGSPPTGAPMVLQVIGGRGGNLPGGVYGSGGAGGPLQLASGNGGSTGSNFTVHAFGGTGGAILMTGGTGGKVVYPRTFVGGDGGSVILQPGAGGSGTNSSGHPGNILLAPSGGNVGIGTTSPGAKLQVIGNFIATGTKSALVETASYGKRQLYAVESPENWFEDFGGAQLIRGRATVKLDPIFAETVSTKDEYHVFLTPKGDCEGLYIASQTADSFEVRELRHGEDTIAFDYRVVAKRKGYERPRLTEIEEAADIHSTEMNLAEK